MNIQVIEKVRRSAKTHSSDWLENCQPANLYPHAGRDNCLTELILLAGLPLQLL